MDLLDSADLPMARAGVFTLFCTGPRLDGRFALHIGSPSEPPFAHAWRRGSQWEWSTASSDGRGTAATLEGSLTAAYARHAAASNGT